MKATAEVVIASIILATVYGVVFSIVYPLVAITAGIMALCAFAGLATTLILGGLWRAIRRK